MEWKHGVGEDAGYVTIPTSVLTPLAPQNSPFDYAPAASNTFGVWQNIDISTNTRPGHVIVKGTEKDFDCKIVGGGQDIWNTSDGFHYFYRECDDQRFEFKGTINAVIQPNVWCKTGFMIRETTNSNSRHVHILQSTNNGRRFQFRANTGGASAPYDGITYDFLNGGGGGNLITPTRFKIARWKNELRFYLDDQLVPLQGGTEYYDIGGWSSNNILVGIALTSHDVNNLSEALFNDMSFEVIPAKGSVLIVR